MQTPSHLIISAAVGTRLKDTAVPFHLPAFLLGGVLPDIPFFLMTVAGEIYYRWFVPPPVSDVSIMEYLHFDLFFTSWWWIVPHNFFHSLVVNALFLGGGWLLWRSQRPWGAVIFWTAVSAQLHTLIDVFTHTSDGPLLFFPLNTSYRFASPVSYWEADSYGLIFIIFEYLLDAVLLVYLWRHYRSGNNLQEENLS